MPIISAAVMLLLLVLLGCSAVTTSSIHAGPAEDQVAAPSEGDRSPETRATIPPPVFIGGLSAEITLRRSGQQMLVDVHIEESGPYPFMFDTGAQYTSVDPKLAEAFPDLVIQYEPPIRTTPEPSGKVLTTNQSMRLPGVRIAEVHLENVFAPVLDHTHISSLADEVVYGVLGIGHFQSLPTRLNLSEGLFEVGVDTSDLDPESRHVVPLEIVHGMPFTEVSFEGHVIWCLIDTGAEGGFNIPTEVFDKLIGDDEELVSEGESIPFSGTPFATRVLEREVDAFLGPFRIASSPNFEFPKDFGAYLIEFGLMGNKVLEHFVITFDPEAGLALFEPIGPVGCDCSDC